MALFVRPPYKVAVGTRASKLAWRRSLGFSKITLLRGPTNSAMQTTGQSTIAATTQLLAGALRPETGKLEFLGVQCATVCGRGSSILLFVNRQLAVSDEALSNACFVLEASL